MDILAAFVDYDFECLTIESNIGILRSLTGLLNGCIVTNPCSPCESAKLASGLEFDAGVVTEHVSMNGHKSVCKSIDIEGECVAMAVD